MKDVILLEDLESISDAVFKNGDFKNSTFFITGATGLVGSLLVKSLLYVNKSLNENIKIYACVRNEDKARQVFIDFQGDSNLYIVSENLLEPIKLSIQFDYIIHTASITASKEMVENPSGVILTSFESTKNLLEYIKIHPSCKMVYISSMEYYGQISDDCTNVTEDKLGYIDLAKVRSCYPESKRMCEALCNAYAFQYNVNVCSARLAQTFGAGVPLSDNRVFAQFAKSAIANKGIVLHTSGLSEGNYCYTADAITAIFLLLLKGAKGDSYNVSCNHSTILNMAKMVAEKLANNRIKVEIRIPDDFNNYGYAPDVKMKLNSTKLRALGWKPSIDLANMFIRMCGSWKSVE